MLFIYATFSQINGLRFFADVTCSLLCFEPIRVTKTYPFTTTIKNVTPVIYWDNNVELISYFPGRAILLDNPTLRVP